MKFTYLTISSLLASTVWARTPVRLFYKKAKVIDELSSFPVIDSDGTPTYMLGMGLDAYIPAQFYLEDNYLVTADGLYLGAYYNQLAFGTDVRRYEMFFDKDSKLIGGVYYMCTERQDFNYIQIGSRFNNKGDCLKVELFVFPVVEETKKLAKEIQLEEEQKKLDEAQKNLHEEKKKLDDMKKRNDKEEKDSTGIDFSQFWIF